MKIYHFYKDGIEVIRVEARNYAEAAAVALSELGYVPSTYRVENKVRL
jgi:hypothetical protein